MLTARCGGWWLILALCCGIFGCGGAGEEGESSTGGGVSQEDGGTEGGNVQIKSYMAADLPKVAEALHNLDGGKVEICPPADWRTLPRNPKYVAIFVLNGANELPRILIKAEDAPAGAGSEITAENWAESAEAHEKALRAASKITLLEPLRPLKLEGRIWLRHVRRVQGPGGDPAVTQTLQTVVGGRTYQIDLSVASKRSGDKELYEASLKEHRDIAYAVAANFRPSGSAAPATPAPAPAAETADSAKKE